MIAARMRSACNVCTDAILLARTFHDEALHRRKPATPCSFTSTSAHVNRSQCCPSFPLASCSHTDRTSGRGLPQAGRKLPASVVRHQCTAAGIPLRAGRCRSAPSCRPAACCSAKYWTPSPSRRRLPPAAAWRISVRAWSPASASWPSASGPMPPTDSTSWGLPDTVCVLGLRLRSARISKTAARTRPRSCATLCQDLRGALSADSCHHVRRWPCDLPLRSRLGGRRGVGTEFEARPSTMWATIQEVWPCANPHPRGLARR